MQFNLNMSKIANAQPIIPNKSKYTHLENESKSKTINDTPFTSKHTALTEITQKYENNIPSTKELKPIFKIPASTALANKINIPTIEAINEKIHVKATSIINPSNSRIDKNAVKEAINPLKRSKAEIGEESHEVSQKSAKPVGSLKLLSDDEKTKTLWPIFRDVDCGFNWKLSLKIFNCCSDDDHKTPEEMITYTSKEVMSELRSVLRKVENVGVKTFNEGLVNYKRHRMHIKNTNI